MWFILTFDLVIADGRVGVVYADTLTLLYESTARLIEKHSPLVETYYGPDWTLPLIVNLQVYANSSWTLDKRLLV